MQIALSILAGVFQLIAAVLGAYMSGRRHPAWFAVFVVLGLSGVGATTWQAVLNLRSADESKGLLRKISDDIGSFTGHPIDGASLGNIQRGISELKAMVKPKPWGLTQEQLATLTRRMAPFSSAEDRGDLITASMGDPDSVKFGFNLVAAFRAANWTLSGSGLSRAVFSGPVTGIIVVVHSQGSDPPGLREFVATLREAGIEVVGEIDDKIPSDRFRIIVGSKPGD